MIVKNKFWKQTIAFLMAFVMIGVTQMPAAYAYTQAGGKSAYVAELLGGKDAPYDLMIRFTSDGMAGLSRKEKAAQAQREAKALLQQEEQSVASWESFYITNAIHAEILSKDLVYALAELPQVERISWNGKVERIEPIESEAGTKKRVKSSKSTIYEPDERDIEWGVLQVHADRVWEEFGIDGTGSVVGIIDGGANYTLPALKKAYLDYDATTDSIIEKQDNPVTPAWEGGAYRDFVDGTSAPQTTSSDDHGTHVAGTVVGQEGQNLNRIGVAPGAKFITARAMGPDGGEEADLIAAAEWMLEMHPDVINNSWGGPNDDDPWFRDVVDAWVEAGIVPVFAAGNTSGKVPGAGTISNPANYPNVLAVAAVDRDKKIGRFSNKGPSAFGKDMTKPEIAAPGVQVRSVDSNGMYVSWDGTSMAAPHVTGVVALVRQAAKQAGKAEQFDTLDEIRALLEETAEPLTDSTYTQSPNIAYGYGLVNAYDAVAKILGRDMVEIQGVVLQDGDDTEPPVVSFEEMEEGYLGRDVRVNVDIRDDVSVRSADLTYTLAGKESVTEKLVLTSGLQNDGVYAFTIPAKALAKGNLHLEVRVEDYGHHIVTAEKDMEIKPGMTLPWTQDFEQAEKGLPGFLMDGSWAISKRTNEKEPELPTGMNGNENTTYIGINGGRSYFERRVDSNLYLPPIDLSDVTAAEHPSLNVDLYHGFTGISIAKVQVSQIGEEGSWQDIHHVILRPDITHRQWTHCTFSLEEYAGAEMPLQIRFYFFGHDSDEDHWCGWYLDNLSVVTNETVAPGQVQALHGVVSDKGLRISFDANEETDLAGYAIERKENGGTFEKIAEIKQDLDSFQFINAGEEDSRTESHYHVNYYDTTAEAGKTYVYRVSAYDFSGNTGAYSEELKVAYHAYTANVSYDFEENDGGFIGGAIAGTINDWQWGRAERPEGDYTLMLPRMAWDGLEKNATNVWGTLLDKKPNVGQDSYLRMPAVTVQEGEYLYFDSYCAMKSLSDSVNFTVEIKESDSDIWLPLVSRETVMNNDQTFTWWQIEASLAAYEGKTVDIRFHSVVDYGWLDSYNLGWYIDNVSVGGKQSEYGTDADDSLRTAGALKGKDRKARGLDLVSLKKLPYNDQKGIQEVYTGTSDGSQGIPFRARVTVEGSDRYTYSGEIDGTYAIRQAAAKNDTYVLHIEAYGYQSQQITVTGGKGTDPIIVPTVYMRPAAKTAISGVVKDSTGKALEGVAVRLVEDENVPLLITDETGAFGSTDVYAGTYTLRFSKKGYRSVEKEVEWKADCENAIGEVVLQPLGDMETETTDYGFVEETDHEGNYQTIQFTGGPHGMAVRFQSPHIGGILESADIFFVKNQYFTGDHVLIGVLSYDEKGRLRELAPFRAYTGLKPNQWNTVDLSEYMVETDRPVYVATTYESHDFSDCMGVYYDTDATEKAISKSFIYDGAFTATSSVSPAGAYAVKANWLYPKGAALNPESDSGDGAGGGDFPILDDETVFIFDKETQTITGYRGNSTSVIIPAEIDGVAVKRIGEAAFDGFGKDEEKRLVSVVIPEGVEEIAADAFQRNKIKQIQLPTTLKSIGERAFRFQYSEGMELTIPDGVTVIKEGAFQSTASPLKLHMPGVTKIEKDAFDGNREMEVYGDKLTEIADNAFGTRYAADFPYAKVYTAADTKLKSVFNQYLINPAKVTVMEINARDHEDILGKTTLYGEGLTAMGRNRPVEKFYQIGKTETIAPPDFRKNGVIYSSADEPVTLKLERENELTFYYYTRAPRMRTPILDVDREILGFSLPNAKIEIAAEGKTYTATANADGYFKVDIAPLAAGTEITVKVNGKEAATETVRKYNNETYIIEGTVIRRYMGDGGSLTLPTAAEGQGAITEIGDFAFCGADLTAVILPDTVETIGIGAFMETGLQSYGWNLKNIDSARLRTINEYAFRGNRLTEAEMPELTHVIRTGAFENNQIEKVQLGKYTGHIGDRAFKNNQIKELVTADTAEEIGEEAFMNNEIEKLTIKPRLEGYTHGLEEIPANAFANNKLKEVLLPDTITSVDETAFAGNTERNVRFIVVSDAKEIVPTAGYDVRRSDGTLLKWRENHTGGGGGGGSSSAPVTPPAPPAPADKEEMQVKVTEKEDGTFLVEMPDGKTATESGIVVALPAGDGTVPVIVHEDGRETIVKKSIVAGNMVKAVLPGPCTIKLIDNSKFFADTNGHWARKAIDFVASREIFSGVGKDSFAPNTPMSRAMLAMVLYRLEEGKAVGGNPFRDVAADAWYADAVQWANAKGIVSGTGEGFMPNENVTREQMAAILFRYGNMLGMDTTKRGDSTRFTDHSRISPWAKEAVAWAVGTGLLSGREDGTLDPAGSATRAEVAAILQRMIGLMVETEI